MLFLTTKLRKNFLRLFFYTWNNNPSADEKFQLHPPQARKKSSLKKHCRLDNTMHFMKMKDQSSYATCATI